MDSKTILDTWKKSESEDSISKVAGVVIVDETLLRQVGGGRVENAISSGRICTVSGECWGFSCNPFEW